MKILHIANDYCGSKVHSRLCSELDRFGIEQVVYTHFEDARKVGANAVESPRVEVLYDPVLKPIHHYLFHLRVAQVGDSMVRRLSDTRFDAIYATTLFSDGALAYRLHRKTGVPYVVAVRKTDVYRFLKLGPHTWNIGRKVLLSASRIMVVSPSLLEAFKSHPMVKAILPKIEDRITLAPNGLEDYWIDNAAPSHCKNHDLLYVGKFDANKNILRLMDAVELLRKRIPDVRLDLVGGTGPLHEQVLSRVSAHPELYSYLGQVYERPKLREIYACHSIFAMPSINETFGLVYLEALSQGLPVLCTRGQGIDGLFPEAVGEFVDPKSPNQMAESLYRLLTEPDCYHTDIPFEDYRWSTVASRYMQIFKQITHSKL